MPGQESVLKDQGLNHGRILVGGRRDAPVFGGWARGLKRALEGRKLAVPPRCGEDLKTTLFGLGNRTKNPAKVS